MRTMNVGGRLALVIGDGIVDVAEASDGRFAPAVQEAFARWDDLRTWADGTSLSPTGPIPEQGVGSPAPRPPQVFAIGLNYRSHAAEGGAQELPETPSCFTKFPMSVAGPYDVVELPQGFVDYEAEMVFVIGRQAYRISEDEAWSYVAGVSVGQDLSERLLQIAGPAPQYSLAKSYRGFTPIGPVLVTPDELSDPDDLALHCRLNGTEVQHARTSDMIFSVAQIVAHVSSILPMLPGDVVFTGTPDGIGFVRNPKVQLRPGDVLETEIEQIGTIRQTFVDRPS
jgi:2-keto-4-pentenoate hydratase/2-oxohepta-3-ene-1,7-dioic acid hydratase in catechol pathway